MLVELPVMKRVIFHLKRRKEQNESSVWKLFSISCRGVLLGGNASHPQLGEELKSGLQSPLGGIHRRPFIPGPGQGWEAEGVSACVGSQQEGSRTTALRKQWRSPYCILTTCCTEGVPVAHREPQPLLHLPPHQHLRATCLLLSGHGVTVHNMAVNTPPHPPRLHCSAWSTGLLRAQQRLGRGSWEFLQGATVCERDHLDASGTAADQQTSIKQQLL